MTMSDPIADMLTRIRNANTAKHDTVDVPSSKMKLAIAEILLKEGYIKKYDVVDEGSFKTIKITLKYGEDKDEKIITGLKRISKPGLRIYADTENLPRFDANDTFTFESGAYSGFQLTTDLSSSLKDYFHSSSEFTFDKDYKRIC